MPVDSTSPWKNGITEYFGGAGYIQTYTATATITAGNLVAFSGNRTVAPTAAGSLIVAGVAMHDAANGGTIAVAMRGVWPLVAQGAITAGARLKAGTVAGSVAAAGATPDASAVIGIAEEAIADTFSGRVKLINLG